jgi:hypothetical protein
MEHSFLLKNNFHTNLCRGLVEDIQFQRSNYHFFLGKIADNVNAQPIAESYSSEIESRSEIISYKKVTPSDISYVIRRIDWTANTVYTQYDSTIDISASDFYVITDTFDVYKCLDNAGGIPSTIQPTSVDIDTIRTPDGYLWKYMYTVPPFKRTKFISELRLPVQNALSDRFYNSGSITGISILTGGSGYEVNLLTYITVTGGTTGSSGSVSASLSGGSIQSVTINSGGTGYTKGCILKVTGDGSGAILTPVITAGVITSVVITNAGSNYTSVGVVVSVGGAILVPSVSKVTGQIVSVTVVDTGIGYSSLPTVQVTGTGTGLYPENAGAVISPVLSNGKLVRANISDPGKDYSAQTSPTIAIIGDGTGATFTPIVYNGSLVDVIVESKGTGYTYASATVYGTGVDATVSVVLADSDLISDQSNIEQTAIDGAIYKIVLVDSGAIYSVATVQIIGDGTGATATATIENGLIVRIDMVTPGSGYSFANVIISGDNTIINPNATNAVAYAIMPPIGGHGKDAVSELFANTVCLYSSIRHDASTKNISQDFREYGVIRGLRDTFTNNFVTRDSGTCSYTVTLNNITGIVKDEVLVVGIAEFRVVDIIASETKIILTQITKNLLTQSSQLIAQTDINRRYLISTITAVPTANKYSGKMLFVSDSDAFTFSNEQEITIKTFLKL